MARYIDVDKLDKLFGEPTEVFLSRLDLKMPPTADVRENVHGKWIFIHPLQEDDQGAYMCSNCKTGSFDVNPKTWKACPWCMADMEEGDSE